MRSFAEADPTGLRNWPASAASVPARSPLPRAVVTGAALFAADLSAALLATIALAHLVSPVAGATGAAPTAPGCDPFGRFAVLSVPVLLALSGHYGERLPFPSEFRQFCAVGLLAFLLAGCSAAFLGDAAAVRVSVWSWLLFPPAAIALRTAAKRALDRFGAWRLPVLLLEAADGLASVADHLRREPLPGYRIASALRADLAERAAETGHWRQLLHAHGASRIAVVTGSDRERDHRIVDSIIRERAPFFVMSRPGSLPVVGWRVTPFLGHDTVVLSYRDRQGDRLSRVAKRLLDLIGASVLLAVAAPLMASLALLIRADGGPAIFRHERIGANGARFRCLKFRTMVPDAADALRRALDGDRALAAEWAAAQKLRDDPRVTRVGRVLRRTSLDELPQLLNVLRGEMSLVGPRPIVADEIPRYAGDIAFYYGARPGLTGLWQVSGRSETSFQQRVRLDRSYVRNWTLAHDLSILLRTVSVVLSRRGAH